MDENTIVRLEKEGIVTSTFRKLNPAKKENIFLTALEAFGTEIFERVILDDLAKAARISKGSLIQYFTFKENIFRFVGEIIIDGYEDYWDIYFQHESIVRVRERIEHYFITHFEFGNTRKAEFEFVNRMYFETDGEISYYFVKRIDEIIARHLQKIIQRGVQTGQIRRDIKITYIVDILRSLLYRLIEEKWTSQTNRDSELSELAERYISVIFEGIK